MRCSRAVVERIKQGLRGEGIGRRCPRRSARLERYVVINAIDHHWQEHLTEMEELRRSIGLRSYGQKDPLVEYKSEAYRYLRGADEQRAAADLHRPLPQRHEPASRSRTCFDILARSRASLQGPERRPPPLAAATRRPAARERAPAAAERPQPAEPEIKLPEGHDPARDAQGRPQRPVPLRQGKKYKHCHGA